MATEQDPAKFYERDFMASIRPGESMSHDVVQVLLHDAGPFSVAYEGAESQLRPFPIAYHFLSHRGVGNHVWLANNDPFRKGHMPEPIFDGLFKIDKRNKRILFEPGVGLPFRDSYRAIGFSYLYRSSLLDILTRVSAESYPFVQITSLRKAVSLVEKENLVQASFIQGEAERLFEKRMGIEAWEAYQVEGPRTLGQLQAGELLPITPLEVQKELCFRRLERDWTNATE